jgi:hypothetical protein
MDQQISRRLAERLAPGEHRLSNRDLREAYGLSRVTAKARASIAAELERAGLHVLSDPADEPLVVRKVARAPAPRPARAPEPPPAARRRPRPGPLAALAAALVLLVVAIAMAPGDERRAAQPPTAQVVEPPAEATPAAAPAQEPAPTLADAAAAVDAGDHVAAMAVADALDDDDRSRVRRMITRSFARQARAALRDGDRPRARRLLAPSARYGSGPELRAARASLRAAQRRAARRAERRRAEAAARRARAAERRAARRPAQQAARAAERAAEAQEAAAAAAPEPAADTSGPSTVNWCGRRDGDGDGISCEGL